MRYTFGLIALMLLVTGCPLTTPPPPKTIEASFAVSESQTKKCYPVVGSITVLLSTGVDLSKVKYEYDFGDGSQKHISANLVASHIYASSGKYQFKVQGLLEGQPQPAFNSTQVIEVAQSERECTYIVGFKSPVGGAKLTTQALRSAGVDLIGKVGGEIVYTYDQVFTGAAARLSPDSLKKLGSESLIEFIDQNTFYKAAETSWNLDRIDQRDLPLSKSFEPLGTGKGVDVYVVDSGVRATHEQFEGRVKEGLNALSPDLSNKDTSDASGHGTHVAGIIAGRTYGVARKANIVPVKIMESDNISDKAALYKALNEITKRHVPGKTIIVNLSLQTINQELDEKIESDLRIEELPQKGLLIVVAAGNNSNNACKYSPARLGKVEGIIVVASSTSDDIPAPDTNMGDCVDIFAPGFRVTSAGHTSNFATKEESGTSMATPHVAGVAALYLEKNPSAPPSQVEAEIKQYASKEKIRFGNDSLGWNTPNRLLFLAPELVQPGVLVKLDKYEITLEVGEQAEFTATVENALDQGVKWEFKGSGTSQSGTGKTFKITAPNQSGEYELTARSMQDEDASATAKIIVVNKKDTVKPTVQLSVDLSTVTKTGEITLTAEASDDRGVRRVEFWEGAKRFYETNTRPYIHKVAFADADNGVHKYFAKAVDESGNEGVSEEAAVTVNIPVVPLVVSITKPTGEAFTNGLLELQFSVTGGVAEEIQILKGNIVLASLGGTAASYSWDTKSEPEGVYEVQVRAVRRGLNFDSGILKVNVDRTPPTIVKRTPESNAANIYVQDPIRIVFSEPILPTSVNDLSVEIVSTGGLVLSKALEIPDEVTLTARLLESPVPPIRLSLSLRGATDRAGNSVIAGQWGWDIGVWHFIPLTKLSFPPMQTKLYAMLIGQDDAPVIAYSTPDDSVPDYWPNTYVARWNGDIWVRIGDAPINSPKTIATVHQLIYDKNGELFVIYTQNDTSSISLRVKRLRGGSWETLGSDGVRNTAAFASTMAPKMVFDNIGTPVLVWGEGSNTYSKYWTGSGWENFGIVLTGLPIEAHYATRGTIGVVTRTKPSTPSALYEEFNLYWLTRSTWESKGKLNDICIGCAMVFKPDIGFVWESVDQAGRVVNATGIGKVQGNYFDAIPDAKKKPLLAVYETGSSMLKVVKQHEKTDPSDTQTVDVLHVLNANPYELQAKLMASQTGGVWLAWSEWSQGPTTTLSVKYFDGLNWSLIGNAPVIRKTPNASETLLLSFATLDGKSRPVLGIGGSCKNNQSGCIVRWNIAR